MHITIFSINLQLKPELSSWIDLLATEKLQKHIQVT